MKVFGFLAFLMFASGAYANPFMFGCQDQPEKKLCALTDAAILAYDWECKGSDCIMIWSDQKNALNDLYNEMINAPNFPVSQEFAVKAKNLSIQICGMTREGPRGELIAITQLENKVLVELYNIQKMVPKFPAGTCEKVVN